MMNIPACTLSRYIIVALRNELVLDRMQHLRSGTHDGWAHSTSDLTLIGGCGSDLLHFSKIPVHHASHWLPTALRDNILRSIESPIMKDLFLKAAWSVTRWIYVHHGWRLVLQRDSCELVILLCVWSCCLLLRARCVMKLVWIRSCHFSYRNFHSFKNNKNTHTSEYFTSSTVRLTFAFLLLPTFLHSLPSLCICLWVWVFWLISGVTCALLRSDRRLHFFTIQVDLYLRILN